MRGIAIALISGALLLAGIYMLRSSEARADAGQEEVNSAIIIDKREVQAILNEPAKSYYSPSQ